MAAVRQSGSRKSAGSRLRAKSWCAERAVASSSRPRTSGRTSSALAWAPGVGRSPDRSNNAFGICVIRSPDAAVHAGHGHGEFCSPWPRTGRNTPARTPPLGALYQLDHSRGTALRRRGKTIAETSSPDQHVRGNRGGCLLRSARCGSLRHGGGLAGSSWRAHRHVRHPNGRTCPFAGLNVRHEQYPAFRARCRTQDRKLGLNLTGRPIATGKGGGRRGGRRDRGHRGPAGGHRKPPPAGRDGWRG